MFFVDLAHDRDFDDLAQMACIEDFLDRNFAHEGATLRADLNQALVGQFDEGFADGLPADRKRLLISISEMIWPGSNWPSMIEARSSRCSWLPIDNDSCGRKFCTF